MAIPVNIVGAVNLAPVVILGGAEIITAGGVTTLELTTLASDEMGEIGWGTGQSAEAVAQTERVAESVTEETVRELARKGVTRHWVEEQLAKYTKTLAEKARALDNKQLLPRKALMEKILSLWRGK